jgi:hypothetical protein
MQKRTAIGLLRSGEKTPSPANSSPPRSVAARTPTPPRIFETPNNLFGNGTPDDLFISPHFRKWDPIKDGRQEETPVDKEDFTHMVPGGLNRLLKKQGKQNERDVQDILGHTKRKAKNYAKLYAKERLLARQSSKGAGRLSKCSRTRGISRSYVTRTS